MCPVSTYHWMPQVNASQFLDLQANFDDDDDESSEEDDLGTYNLCYRRINTNPQIKSPS
jgi:hypothetical protein